jgi:hypothetical protein
MERMSFAAHTAMREQAPLESGMPRGVMVNLASGAAFRAIPLRNGYSASKAGVVAMTRAHGVAWARSGIRVNALAPGYIRTDLVAELIAKGRVDPMRVERRVPLGRMGTPEEMAACIHFLTSSAEAYGQRADRRRRQRSLGAADDAPVRCGAAPCEPLPRRPAVVVAGAETVLGAACVSGLRTRGFDVAGRQLETRPAWRLRRGASAGLMVS